MTRTEKVTPMKLDAFAPFTQFNKVFETWSKLADESIARTASFYAEMDKVEAKGIERVESAFEEMAKLTKESLAYTAQVHAEWRKLALESFQRAATLGNETTTAAKA
jgi:hypothetical protein